MGVHHSMNRDQVDEVLTEFEGTTESIKGIEGKMSMLNSYILDAKTQREEMSRKAEDATDTIDKMADQLNDKAGSFLTYFTTTLETFATLVDELEHSIMDIGLQEAPKRMQREFGPLLVPAIVLFVIITVSNCYFGFLLASDPGLARRFAITDQTLTPGISTDSDASGINVLNLFAVFHVVLIGLATFFLIIEGLRKLCKPRRRSSSSKEAEEEDDSADLDDPPKTRRLTLEERKASWRATQARLAGHRVPDDAFEGFAEGERAGSERYSKEVEVDDLSSHHSRDAPFDPAAAPIIIDWPSSDPAAGPSSGSYREESYREETSSEVTPTRRSYVGKESSMDSSAGEVSVSPLAERRHKVSRQSSLDSQEARSETPRSSGSGRRAVDRRPSGTWPSLGSGANSLGLEPRPLRKMGKKPVSGLASGVLRRLNTSVDGARRQMEDRNQESTKWIPGIPGGSPSKAAYRTTSRQHCSL